jgi:hypothetical protein
MWTEGETSSDLSLAQPGERRRAERGRPVLLMGLAGLSLAAQTFRRRVLPDVGPLALRVDVLGPGARLGAGFLVFLVAPTVVAWPTILSAGRRPTLW